MDEPSDKEEIKVKFSPAIKNWRLAHKKEWRSLDKGAQHLNCLDRLLGHYSFDNMRVDLDY